VTPRPNVPVPRHDLDAVPLLANLTPAIREGLLEGADTREWDKGETLFDEGGAADRLFVLLSGCVELHTSAEGRDATLLILRPPETCLPSAALTDEPYLASARTLEPSRLLALDAARVRGAVEDCPVLAHHFTRILSGQFRSTVRDIKDLKLRGAPQRLAAFLLRLIDETGREGCADLPLTKAVIASRLGLSAETLSRALHVLRDKGMTVRGSRIVLHDRERFERFCAPDPLIDGNDPDLPVALL
jgi:CRP/FNR family transcriptional activator FtrB